MVPLDALNGIANSTKDHDDDPGWMESLSAVDPSAADWHRFLLLRFARRGKQLPGDCLQFDGLTIVCLIDDGHLIHLALCDLMVNKFVG